MQHCWCVTCCWWKTWNIKMPFKTCVWEVIVWAFAWTTHVKLTNFDNIRSCQNQIIICISFGLFFPSSMAWHFGYKGHYTQRITDCQAIQNPQTGQHGLQKVDHQAPQGVENSLWADKKENTKGVQVAMSQSKDSKTQRLDISIWRTAFSLADLQLDQFASLTAQRLQL